MDKLTLLKKIKQEAKSNITIEELEIIIDSCFKILNIRLDCNENKLANSKTINLDSVVVKNSNPSTNPGKPYGTIPGIVNEEAIGYPKRNNYSTDKF